MRVFYLAFILAVFAPPALAEDSTVEVQALYKAYQNIWLRNDNTVEEAIMGLLAPDAAVMPQAQPVLNTPEAIRAFWFPKGAGSTQITEYQQTVERTVVSGDTAYLYGGFSLQFEWDGKIAASTGTQLLVATKLDGVWKIQALIWNSIAQETN